MFRAGCGVEEPSLDSTEPESGHRWCLLSLCLELLALAPVVQRLSPPWCPHARAAPYQLFIHISLYRMCEGGTQVAMLSVCVCGGAIFREGEREWRKPSLCHRLESRVSWLTPSDLALQ